MRSFSFFSFHTFYLRNSVHFTLGPDISPAYPRFRWLVATSWSTGAVETPSLPYLSELHILSTWSSFAVSSYQVSDFLATSWSVHQAPSVHGISKARILEWVAMPSSRGSFPPRNGNCISCTGRRVLSHQGSQSHL